MTEVQIEEETLEQIFTRLYEEVFATVAELIRKMGGTLEETKDIFQDALVVYYERSIEEDFSLQQNEKAYLIGICKHLWYKKHSANSKEERLDSMSELRLSEENELHVSESIMQFVEKSGKKCLDLLKAFYYEKLDMKRLAERFGFSGERSATVQKFKCLEKVRTAIQKRSLNKEDFYE